VNSEIHLEAVIECVGRYPLGGHDRSRLEEYLKAVDLDAIDLMGVNLEVVNLYAVNLEAVERKAYVMEAESLFIG